MEQTSVQSVPKEFKYSIGMHVLIVLAGIIYLPPPDEFLVPETAISIDLISIGEFTRLAQPKPIEVDVQPEVIEIPVEPIEPVEVKAVEPVEVKAVEQILPSGEVTPPIPPLIEAEVEVEVEVEDKSVLPAPADASQNLNPEPKLEEQFANLVARPRPLERPIPVRPKPAKSFLNTQVLQALLDKTPDALISRPPDVPLAEGEKLTLSEIDALRGQMKVCWNVPVGAAHADNLVVRVELGLNRDGSLAHGPFIADKSRIHEPYFRAAAESVLRAIRRCQPFNMPADKYRSWQRMELNFDPKKMFGR